MNMELKIKVRLQQLRTRTRTTRRGKGGKPRAWARIQLDANHLMSAWSFSLRKRAPFCDDSDSEPGSPAPDVSVSATVTATAAETHNNDDDEGVEYKESPWTIARINATTRRVSTTNSRAQANGSTRSLIADAPVKRAPPKTAPHAGQGGNKTQATLLQLLPKRPVPRLAPEQSLPSTQITTEHPSRSVTAATSRTHSRSPPARVMTDELNHDPTSHDPSQALNIFPASLPHSSPQPIHIAENPVGDRQSPSPRHLTDIPHRSTTPMLFDRSNSPVSPAPLRAESMQPPKSPSTMSNGYLSSPFQTPSSESRMRAPPSRFPEFPAEAMRSNGGTLAEPRFDSQPRQVAPSDATFQLIPGLDRQFYCFCFLLYFDLTCLPKSSQFPQSLDPLNLLLFQLALLLVFTMWPVPHLL